MILPDRRHFPIIPAVSTVQCNTRVKFTSRRFEVQGLSRALIEAQCYLVESAWE